MLDGYNSEDMELDEFMIKQTQEKLRAIDDINEDELHQIFLNGDDDDFEMTLNSQNETNNTTIESNSCNNETESPKNKSKKRMHKDKKLIDKTDDTLAAKKEKKAEKQKFIDSTQNNLAKETLSNPNHKENITARLEKSENVDNTLQPSEDDLSKLLTHWIDILHKFESKVNQDEHRNCSKMLKNQGLKEKQGQRNTQEKRLEKRRKKMSKAEIRQIKRAKKEYRRIKSKINYQDEIQKYRFILQNIKANENNYVNETSETGTPNRSKKENCYTIVNKEPLSTKMNNYHEEMEKKIENKIMNDKKETKNANTNGVQSIKDKIKHKDRNTSEIQSMNDKEKHTDKNTSGIPSMNDKINHKDKNTSGIPSMNDKEKHKDKNTSGIPSINDKINHKDKKTSGIVSTNDKEKHKHKYTSGIPSINDKINHKDKNTSGILSMNDKEKHKDKYTSGIPSINDKINHKDKYTSGIPSINDKINHKDMNTSGIPSMNDKKKSKDKSTSGNPSKSSKGHKSIRGWNLMPDTQEEIVIEDSSDIEFEELPRVSLRNLRKQTFDYNTLSIRNSTFNCMEKHPQNMKDYHNDALNIITEAIHQMPRYITIAHMGCGKTDLSYRVPQTVWSFDSVTSFRDVIACDLTQTPLPPATVQVVIYCLSLADDVTPYLVEANRVLVFGGEVLIVEERCRFEQVEVFTWGVERLGFRLLALDRRSYHFYYIHFVKTFDTTNDDVPKLKLKPNPFCQS